MKGNDYNKYLVQRVFLRRIWIVAFLVLMCLGLLFARFAWLQILHYEKYARRANINRITPKADPPVRGPIIDRNGVVLAYSESVYTIEVVPNEVKNLDALLDELQTVITISNKELRRFRTAYQNARPRFIGVPLKVNLTQQEVAALSAQLYRFPGVGINTTFVRRYPLGATGSHFVGYIHSINENDLSILEEKGLLNEYIGTKEIGRTGIEAAYETSLHGHRGAGIAETTAGGRFVRWLEQTNSQPGDLIQLTIDIRMQQLVETLYGERRGAFVAMDPRNGEVLALVSMPTFDPNIYISGFDQDTWNQLSDEVNRPLFNRAIGGTYPIGSTYKPFMALAGLETGVRTSSEVITDPGAFTIGASRWRSSGGKFDVTRAIIKSNNYYFYSLAYDLGINRIHDFMAPFNFGQITGIDLSGEVSGILPSTQWKKEAFKAAEDQRWYDGETVNAGIGQGHNRFTMLQLASAVATLVSYGQKHTPHLLLGDKDVMTGGVTAYQDNQEQLLEISPENVQVILEAMMQVPIQGTAKHAFAGAAYTSGGKTGTAQSVSMVRGRAYDPAVLEEFKRDHSLYIAFAPAENPQIVIAMIVENGLFGATSAVPIARRVFDYYLLGVYPSERDIELLQGENIRRPQDRYSGPPVGTPRSVDEYDIIPQEMLIPLSMLEVKPTVSNVWNESQSTPHQLVQEVE